MHTCVGAPSRSNFDWLLQNLSKRTFKNGGDGFYARVRCKAVIVITFVGNGHARATHDGYAGLDEFDTRHRCVVTVAWSELHDACVSTVATDVARSNDIDQLVSHFLVVEVALIWRMR